MPVTNGRPAATERTLADGHLKMLKASAISEEIADARGYLTARKRTELGDLGFAPSSRSSRHSSSRYGASPARSSITSPGRTGRGSTPNAAARSVRNGRRIRDPAGRAATLPAGSARPATLWITEGAKKGRRAGIRGRPAIGLLASTASTATTGTACSLRPPRVRRLRLRRDGEADVHKALSRIVDNLGAKGADVGSSTCRPRREDRRRRLLAKGATIEDVYGWSRKSWEPPPEAKPTEGGLPTAYLLAVIVQRYLRFLRSPASTNRWRSLLVLHTLALEAAQATPYMLVGSPEKRSGKTRVLRSLNWSSASRSAPGTSPPPGSSRRSRSGRRRCWSTSSTPCSDRRPSRPRRCAAC